MEPKIIKTEKQYQAALAVVERLTGDDPVPGTPDGDRLKLIARLDPCGCHNVSLPIT